MNLSEFEESIEKALNKVPKQFREILVREGIQVLARERVPKTLREQYKGHLLFGIFAGIPYNKRSMADGKDKGPFLQLPSLSPSSDSSYKGHYVNLLKFPG